MKSQGFTLIELIVSMAIVGSLAAVAAPVYTRHSLEGKIRMSEANMLNIRQAFINHFYLSTMDMQTEFPPVPSDSIMDTEWAESALLYNDKTPASLFSANRVPVNGFGEPFLYALLEASDTERYGFMIKDPTTGKVMKFRP